MIRVNARLVGGIVGLVLAAGCSGTLPEPIYANQVDVAFPEAQEDGSGAEVQRLVREDAEQCADNLNDHRGDAEIALIVQGIVNGFGGAVGSAGGVMSAIDFDDQDVTTAMGVMAAIGSGITLVGNLILGLLANPQEELRLHGRAQRSWEVAVELQHGEGAPRAIRTALQRCVRDEPPPVRVEGSGPHFSL